MRKKIAILLTAIMLFIMVVPVSADALTVGTPSITGGTYGPHTINIDVQKTKNVTGYILYQKVGDKWQKISTKKAASAPVTTFEVDELKGYTKYTFSVKAYRKVDGKTYYSSRSKSVTVKTPRSYSKYNGRWQGEDYEIELNEEKNGWITMTVYDQDGSKEFARNLYPESRYVIQHNYDKIEFVDGYLIYSTNALYYDDYEGKYVRE